MKWPSFRMGRSEVRASPENPTIPVSSENFLQFFGVQSSVNPHITIDQALTVPAVWAAVGFLSRSLANLPLHAFKATGDGNAERVGGPLQRILNENPNSECTSFGFRQYFWQQCFTTGRGLAWVERAGSTVVAIWPIDATETYVKRVGGRKFYTYGGKEYPAADVIDVPYMLKSDQLGVYGPINQGAKAINLALAMGDYAAGFFAGGGVPPLALSGPMPSGAEAMKRAQGDVKRAIDGAKERGEVIMPIPAGYTLSPVGFDPAKGQMTEARRLQIEELSRIWGLPPVFLQDLTHGTFSNTEQQDLHLVKHLLAQWAKALEEEMNLKIFGPVRNSRYVEHSLDGMQRGDFKSRMEGMGHAVQSALRTPNELRALDNLPPKDGGDNLFIQGATVPLGTQPRNGETDPAGGNNVPTE
jgi:HK97 family phage portal protein